MLAKISKFFQELSNNDETAKEALTPEMACAVLLCEVMRADHELDQQEQIKLRELLSVRFNLNENEIEELITQALTNSNESNDLYFYTSLINKRFTINEKQHLVSMLWKLAQADGNISAIESHIIRKIADLLHLRHSEYIATKPDKTE